MAFIPLRPGGRCDTEGSSSRGRWEAQKADSSIELHSDIRLFDLLETVSNPFSPLMQAV